MYMPLSPFKMIELFVLFSIQMKHFAVKETPLVPNYFFFTQQGIHIREWSSVPFAKHNNKT